MIPTGVRDHLVDEVGPDHQHPARVRDATVRRGPFASVSQTAGPVDRRCGLPPRGTAVGEMAQSEPVLFGDFHLHKVKTSSKHIPFDWSGPDA